MEIIPWRLYLITPDTLTTAFERFFTIEDFTDMDQHRCRACSKTFDLLVYASLSLTQA